ncbi:hypothetical protein B0H10DRAFT_2447921 [Mycena sp. CBHHK59/15]|nr:hypothetical protein B0H10DRAFT_2447921 [Mycena sp. CBHHK59/15]
MSVLRNQGQPSALQEAGARWIGSEPPSVCQQGSDYIDVRKASDVQTAFAFSKKTGVPLVVKSTGHDYKGRSSAPGSLALWTHNLQALSYNSSFVPVGCSASSSKPAITIGAGQIVNNINAFAEANNITVMTGAETSVGASGGWLQNTDLFWALRGGGGGTFGVVLESTTLVSPNLTLQVAFAAFSRTNTIATRGFYEVIVENSVKWVEQGPL